MKNKLFVGCLVIILMVFIFVSLFRKSYANVMDNDIVLDIYDNKNSEELIEEMKNYIDLVDEHIIVNSSFNLSNTLNENYDFLTMFVISFILDHEEYFDIVYGENRIYVDKYGVEYMSNKYIDIDVLYDITYRVFGVEYYYVLDEGLVIDDMLLLVDVSKSDFNMYIDKIIFINHGNDYYDVRVNYNDYDINYIYRFNILSDNRLVISNLLVGE